MEIETFCSFELAQTLKSYGYPQVNTERYITTTLYKDKRGCVSTVKDDSSYPIYDRGDTYSTSSGYFSNDIFMLNSIARPRYNDVIDWLNQKNIFLYVIPSKFDGVSKEPTDFSYFYYNNGTRYSADKNFPEYYNALEEALSVIFRGIYIMSLKTKCINTDNQSDIKIAVNGTIKSNEVKQVLLDLLELGYNDAVTKYLLSPQNINIASNTNE